MPELAARLLAEQEVTAHPASLSRLLIQQGFTVKKNSAGQRNRSR
jgi:transposase